MSKKRGESLIESLLSLFFITTIIIPTSNILTKMTNINYRVNNDKEEQINKRNLLEKLKSLDYEDIEKLEGEHTIDFINVKIYKQDFYYQKYYNGSLIKKNIFKINVDGIEDYYLPSYEDKNRGALLIEFLVSIFIFVIIVMFISSFLNKIKNIEENRAKDHILYENYYYTVDRLVEDIINRDININVEITNNQIIYFKDGLYYKLLFKDGSLYISSSINLTDFGRQNKVGDYQNVSFIKNDGVMEIHFKNEKFQEKIRVISLR